MMTLTEELVSAWGGGSVVLSPRDMTIDQMKRVAKSVKAGNGNVFVDPQFYVPRSEQAKLTAHSFWPDDYETAAFNSDSVQRLIEHLNTDYNQAFGTAAFIAPAVYASIVDENWYKMQRLYLEAAQKVIGSKPLYLTACLGNEVIGSESMVHQTIEYIQNLPVTGVYLVAEHPKNQYLVDDPVWLLNLLDLVAGLKLQGKRVIVGYANQQSLLLSLTGVDAIACGNFMNVRNFSTSKFEVIESTPSRRSTWYYSPQAMSEYQVAMLDIAARASVLDQLKSDSSAYKSTYADVLFSGAQPSSTNYKERDSFLHFLTAVRAQAASAVKPTYDETKQSVTMRIQTARSISEFMQQVGITGKNKDFSQVADIQLSTVHAFNRVRGMTVRHNWNRL